MKTFIVLCFSLCLVEGSEADACNNYTVLSEADRAQGHIVINASNYRCDRDDLVPGWYRFQGAAGDRMADKCVPENHCGSRWSGWLSAAHPSMAEGVVNRTVCFSSSYHCCAWYQNIRIKNCGAYFVYQLPRPYPNCPARYCGNGSAVDACNNYTVLSEADRAQGHIVINTSNYRCDRDDLVPGWYRFQGAAGDRMTDKCVPAYHCGTQYPGWLNGTHPTVSEGVVTRRVCYPDYYYHWYWYGSGHCCYWYNNIRVRNCGAFFLYELLKPPSCYFRYCGNGTAVDGCNNYTVLSEADRAQGHIVINASNYRCDRDDLVPGWYRFQGAAGDRMADKCVPENHCGTQYPGWLNGTHPTVSQGVVTRRVCYPYYYYYWYWYWHWHWYRSSSCCPLSRNIRVRNCGAFFVYELLKPPSCYLRYCGNATEVDGCNNYTVLSKADRAQGHIVINSSYRRGDDDLVPGWYRFQGAAGDRMADKCVPIDHCGTYNPGWLSGAHPTVEEGVVSRGVCFSVRQYCCYWYQDIRIKNCGAYFVYELPRLRYWYYRYYWSYHARYCGNGSGVDACNNYTVLSEADRAQGHMVINASNYRCDRDDLVPGWYRFQGAAGDQMADKCVPKNHCGSRLSGWLSGVHPSIAEGVVTRRICFPSSYHCCLWYQNIRIRNCGGYFVYELPRPYLSCPVRYCGNGSAVDVCNNYTVLSEADRAQGHIVNNASNYRCHRDDLVPGWYRFQGAAGDWMADKCVPEGHCGTRYPVWLSGAHPTVAEGLVTRRVCYHVAWSNSCCYWTNNIRIKNCGAYFVYELPRQYSCPARYCGSGIAAYTCPALTVPPNGIKFGCPENATMYNDTVCQFSCNDGYIGSGSQVRRCQLNGTWSAGQDFTCQIINCTSLTQMVDPGGPLRIGSCDNHFGAQCDFFCTIGYRLNGSSTVTCVAPGNQHPGVWNNTIPTCEEILCEPPQLAPNLKVNTSCSRLPGDSCEFTCERGYDLIGSSTRTCNSEGSWTGTQPRCDAVKCSELSPPNNGELLGCNTTEMLYNTVCRSSCDEGYEAKGSMVRTCTENGTWSGTDLVCIGNC